MSSNHRSTGSICLVELESYWNYATAQQPKRIGWRPVVFVELQSCSSSPIRERKREQECAGCSG
jgi:hypothetical protein